MTVRLFDEFAHAVHMAKFLMFESCATLEINWQEINLH